MFRLLAVVLTLGLMAACGADSDPTPKDTGACTTEWYRDLDGDGYGDPTDTVVDCTGAPEGYVESSGDCDDALANINPGAIETCDGRDEDCDGLVDDEPSDGNLYFADADGDGYGDPASSIEACSLPSGYAVGNTDCDDAVASTNPGAEERCNGLDDDCNGVPDDGLPGEIYYLDADGDGYGDPAAPTEACAPPDGYAANDSDCDDAAPSINPGATETCDGTDEDCDGLIDEPEDVAYQDYYLDLDGDGYGDDSTGVEDCAPSKGRVAEGGDCDDGDPAVSPGATEVCNGLDDDCDSLVDDEDPSVDAKTAPVYYADADFDGYGDASTFVSYCSDPGAGWSLSPLDCDDANPDVNPDATEVCNGRDDDCDGTADGADAVDAIEVWADVDGDGFGDDLVGLRECSAPTGYVDVAGDCDDSDPTIYPAAPEDCDDKVDRNCDGAVGYVDGDEDGYYACEECDDGDAAINPGEVEVCDGLDNDCNGAVDDDGAGGSPWAFYVDDDGDGFGAPGSYLVDCGGFIPGYADNDDDCDDGDPARNPLATEICNRVDDDCDGVIPPEELDDDGDGVSECEGDPDDSDPTVSAPACAYLEDFEDGSWPAPGWVSVDGGGTVSGASAHDGSFGLNDPDWHYTEETLFGYAGDLLSAWVRPNGSGRVYLGFSASSAGSNSLVVAPNTTELLLQDNDGWGYSDVDSASVSWTYGDWYWLTVEFVGGNEVVGTAYLDDMSTVHATVSHTFSDSVIGGLAIRSFSDFDTDSIEYCPAP